MPWRYQPTYIRLRQAGVEKPERETFEGALKTGRLALESLGLGPMSPPGSGNQRLLIAAAWLSS